MAAVYLPPTPPDSLPTRIIWEPDSKEMILIPGGEYVIGRNDGRKNEQT